jgi:hypothetical protein
VTRTAWSVSQYLGTARMLPQNSRPEVRDLLAHEEIADPETRRTNARRFNDLATRLKRRFESGGVDHITFRTIRASHGLPRSAFAVARRALRAPNGSV